MRGRTQVAIGGVGVVDPVANLVSRHGVFAAGQVRQIERDFVFGLRRQIAFVKDLIDHVRAGKSVGEIPNQRLHAAGFVGANPRGWIAVLQFHRAEPVQKLIRIKRRLVDVLIIDEAEAAVKRLPARAGFLEDVRERPVGHGLRGVAAFLELFQDVSGAVVAVVNRVGRRVGRAPFGEVQFQLGHRRIGNLLAHPFDVANDGVRVAGKGRAGGAVTSR